MDLSPYVENLRIELVVAADAGGDEARALAERLTSPLEAAARLTLLSALSDAVDEITRELAPGSVDLRLRGLNPEFVVNPGVAVEYDGPLTGHTGHTGPVGRPAAAPDQAAAPAHGLPAPEPDDDGGTARINFRVPAALKSRIDEAAAAEGLSVNAWLVRAANAALAPAEPARQATPQRSRRYGADHFTGWVR
jgi:hypothetical protein